jgi:hypothetical protein
MANTPLTLEYFHTLTADQGWKVGDYLPINGHHLVYKIPVDQETGKGIVLPEQYRRKATKNVVMIRGFVLRASAPWNRKHSKKRMIWDNQTESWKADWDVWDAAEPRPSDFEDGVGILYNSYNVGKVKVRGLPEPLVVVRDIDVEAIFPIETAGRVGLGAKCMDQFQDRYRTHVQI